MLKPEINSHDVRNNLLMHEQLGSYLYYFANNEERKRGTIDLLFGYLVPSPKIKKRAFLPLHTVFIKILDLIWQ